MSSLDPHVGVAVRALDPPDEVWAEREQELAAERDANASSWARGIDAAEMPSQLADVASKASAARREADALNAQADAQPRRRGYDPIGFRACVAEGRADDLEARARALSSIVRATVDVPPTASIIVQTRVSRPREHRARRTRSTSTSSSSPDGSDEPPPAQAGLHCRARRWKARARTRALASATWPFVLYLELAAVMERWPWQDPSPCDDCGVNTTPHRWRGDGLPMGRRDYYMVRDDVWAQAGGAHYLCIGCLEQRLGRALTPDDFPSDVPINQPCEVDSPRLATAKSYRACEGAGR